MAINAQTNPTTLNAGLQIYADEVIKALQAYALPLAGFAKNFSKKIGSQPNGGIFVPFVEADVVGDYAATGSSVKNFATGSNATIKGALVKLGAHKLCQFAVTPDQLAEFDPIWWTERAQMNAKAMCNAVFTAIAGVAISTKVTQSVTLPATITVGDVVELAKQAHNYNIPIENSTLYLTGAEYFDLLKVLDYKTTGNMALINGTLAGVSVGFKAIVCLPTTVTAGFVGSPDFICAAARPYVDGMGVGGNILREDIYADAVTGLPFVHTLVRDSATKSLTNSIDCWFGAELGNKNAGIKLARASASAS